MFSEDREGRMIGKRNIGECSRGGVTGKRLVTKIGMEDENLCSI